MAQQTTLMIPSTSESVAWPSFGRLATP
jgi:hypothetical protein